MNAENHLKDFTDSNDEFKNLINESTCFKSTWPTTIDLFLTNRKGFFTKSPTNETKQQHQTIANSSTLF